MISDDSNRQLTLNDIDPLTYSEFMVTKRDGRQVGFDPALIRTAIEKAFKAEQGVPTGGTLGAERQQEVSEVAAAVTREVMARAVRGEQLKIERIQDAVESQLMRAGHYAIARRYIVYREDRKRARALAGEKDLEGRPQETLQIRLPDGSHEHLDAQKVRRTLLRACDGFEDVCDWQGMADEVLGAIYHGITLQELEQALMLAARGRIERDPAYSYVAARLLLRSLYKEVWGRPVPPYEHEQTYRASFRTAIARGVEIGAYDPALLEYDFDALCQALVPGRDLKFNYLGLQTVYDRYLMKVRDRRLELPQYFWMRVAMGLALKEGEQKTARAIEFYHVLSSFRCVSSTPTLFNSGTRHPQLSSCYLLTVMDDLEHIFKIIKDDAMLSKWAGGLGNDWTNIRATGSYINGTHGRSQGVIPFLKVANDTAVAVNQGGKRKGAMCAYLETWHLDIEEFLALRQNTGDDRRRTHDMNTANWIPDLFMKRVRENGEWTLFSPSDTPDLHDRVGRDFEEAYAAYEAKTHSGEITLFKRLPAMDLWRKMITALFETGHPWLTFKDPSNIRSPQQHVGVVHSSNLCTEILLNTSQEESAVCNLASVNLVEHFDAQGRFDEAKLAETVRTAIRMLDNVIDINFYPTPETRTANLRHRPVGLGLMGFQDALYIQRIPYDSAEGVAFADRSMEVISYHAILASATLAAERGPYSSFAGSLWDRGILPIDSIDLLAQQRGGYLDMDRSQSLDWTPVREAIRRHGMRNSNTMAIAPTATISNICGVSQSIEPAFTHLYTKSNLGGDFTVVNPYLVEDLKRLGLWDSDMVDDLKYFDGSLQGIERIPADLRRLYSCAFELEARWLLEAASRRQKWIDMGQSLNLYVAEADGRKISEMYQFGWEKGLKTTYYLRATAKTTVEKSTQDINRRGLQPRWMTHRSASADVQVHRQVSPLAAAPGAGASDVQLGLPNRETQPASLVTKQCLLDDPTCESCQ
jgi:ribonucleoside-diphosphate reductase alpha chain